MSLVHAMSPNIPLPNPRSRTTGEEMSSVGIIVKFRVLKGVEWELGFACFWTRKMGFRSPRLEIPKTKLGMETHLYNTHHM